MDDRYEGIDSLDALQKWWDKLDPAAKNVLRWLASRGLVAFLAYICMSITSGH